MENTANKLRLVFGDCTLGVKGADFHYIFSYTRGGLESLNKSGKEWLYRETLPAFWRATTDNDRGNKFSSKSSMWLGADLFMNVRNIRVIVDENRIELPVAPVNNQYTGQEDAETVEIVFSLETTTVPQTTVDVSYRVNQEGEIYVVMHYFGKKGLPELPLLGLRFIMPTKAKRFNYEGLSGETYPDRMAGGIPGTYEVEGLPVTPYLVPQDCGVHMGTKWLEIIRDSTLNNADRDHEEFSLRFEQLEDSFAFSALPFKAEELENATHIEELPPERRTVLLMLAKVRGVGGIDSWGAEVEEDYRINAEKDYKFSFVIK
ncbi:beta-galactosidase small subunit [Enterococcus sp. CWB-B31]|uniref:beta-galactosidase small subunit n=1 Tax=Enterococcus sp. CWB-B31 TaxID=2885159 RepID=UPI001E358F52|nr:beta-galactosidase small subunit [Enterococcus sp. CWB-B31]MCB5955436.1 beta-galactosidase small subunit [Enterococcus sp. CWB-B31]